MVVQLAGIIGVIGEVEDEVARGMFLIEESSDRADAVLMERVVVGIGHD